MIKVQRFFIELLLFFERLLALDTSYPVAEQKVLGPLGRFIDWAPLILVQVQALLHLVLRIENNLTKEIS